MRTDGQNYWFPAKRATARPLIFCKRKAFGGLRCSGRSNNLPIDRARSGFYVPLPIEKPKNNS
jgi:hypothetical protein